MKKIIAVSLILGVMLATIGLVFAGQQGQSQKQNKEFALPKHAVEVAPGVFSLGWAIDKGRFVEGYAMFVKPGTECGNGICDPGENARKCPEDCSGGEDPDPEPDTSSCYTLLAKGAKWKTVEPYIVDPTNTRELNEDFVRNNLALDIDKWETKAGVDILGNEVAGIVDGADLESPDNKNEVMFADIDYDGAIAVAIVWGIFSGPPFNRELVEWDMIFDDADFDWSATGEAGKMDFENIATHELGHAVGLGDLYNAECSEQTMYGYAVYGETNKRSLEAGDIAGISALY